jgi:hypothetical protein
MACVCVRASERKGSSFHHYQPLKPPGDCLQDPRHNGRSLAWSLARKRCQLKIGVKTPELEKREREAPVCAPMWCAGRVFDSLTPAALSASLISLFFAPLIHQLALRWPVERPRPELLARASFEDPAAWYFDVRYLLLWSCAPSLIFNPTYFADARTPSHSLTHTERAPPRGSYFNIYLPLVTTV